MVWDKWLSIYMEQKPKIIANSCPKYVLLNEIAKKINVELISIKESKERVEYM